MTPKMMMVAQFVRDQARWRLDRPGLSAVPAARSVVALLDAAVCVADLPDDHPDLEALARAGCFRDGVFDPGEAGMAVVRGWMLPTDPAATDAATQPAATQRAATQPATTQRTGSQPPSAPRDLLHALAVAATRSPGRAIPRPAHAPDTASLGSSASFWAP